MQDNFSITPRVIAHLGEALIKNESIALLELVKNAYDANATECKVFFEQNKYGELEKIVITDNGDGMNLSVVKEKWLVIGTDNKKKILEEHIREKKTGRIPLGEKGVGRLGVHKLGNKISMFTKTIKDDEISLNIDWSKLSESKTISDFKISINENKSPQLFKDKSHGTQIEISSLKKVWDRRKIRDVYRSLLALNSPFVDTDDEFKIIINSNSNLFSGLPTFEDIKSVGMYFAHCLLKDTKIVDFFYEFKPWKSLDKVSTGRNVTTKNLIPEDLTLKGVRYIEDENGKEKKEEYTIDLNKNMVGSIELDVIIFEPDTQIISLMNLEKTTFRSYMKANGGIRVYRDNVRVYDYGEPDDDWLGINEQRIHHIGGNIGNQIVLGAVRLKRTESLGLEEKTNREGFVENEAYLDLVNAVNYTLSLIVRERNVDKSYLSNLYRKQKIIEPVKSDLNEVIELVEKKVEKTELKEEILNHLYRIKSQYDTVRETLLRSANAGLNLGAIIHELEKQVAILSGCVIRNDVTGVKTVSDRLEGIIRKATSLLKKSDIKKQTVNKTVKSVLEGFEYRFNDHNIELVYNEDTENILALYSESAIRSSLTNLLDNSIYWLSYIKRNAAKISVYITNQLKDYVCIIVSDNGPGFTIPESLAIEPFISGKPNNVGTGLGLHICHEMMKAINGKMEFCTENDFVLPKNIKNKDILKAIIALYIPKAGE